MAKPRIRNPKPDQIIEKILNDKKLRQSMVRRSFEFFFPIYFHSYIKYETAPFHKELFRILENEVIKLAVIVAFRGSAKSTIITTAYVLWAILGEQERKFIVIAGKTEQKARQYLSNIKMELEQNELLKKDLGPFTEVNDHLGNATAIIIKKLNVKIMVTSTGQSIRGMRHGEHRPDLIILDDIEDLESVKTREGRNKTFDWLTGELIPAGESGRTRIIAVGNLLHEDSVLKRLQKKIEADQMKSMKPVYCEFPIVDDQGNALWKAKYPTPEHVEAERERTMDEVAWHREYLLKIISTDEQIVRPEWINYYAHPPNTGLRRVAIGIDLAVSEKETADYTAMVVGHAYGYGKNMEIYIQPNPVNQRVSFPVQVELIKSLVAVEKRNHARVKLYIEEVAYQKALVQLFESQRYDVVGVSTGRSDKATRLRFATPLMKEGKVFFPETGCEELIEQLLGFGKEKHDDLADAFAMMVLKTIEDNPRGCTIGTGRPDLL
jgi:predicted phage terminase large subunit-like protein